MAPGSDRIRQPASPGRTRRWGRRRDDHRQPAGHRLEHRHGEALAAVREHEDVTGAVELGQLVGCRGRPRSSSTRGSRLSAARCCSPCVRPAVGPARHRGLDHQHDVLTPGERPVPGAEQDVGALAVGDAADVQEPLRRPAGARAPPAGVNTLEVDAVRNHVTRDRRRRRSRRTSAARTRSGPRARRRCA